MINYKDFLKTVDLFRDFCLTKYSDVIDLVPQKEREMRLGSLKGAYDLNIRIMSSIDPLSENL